MARFCVFTPTYNRAYTLRRLYESLVRQTFHDFHWLIIDDGSTDDTEELVSSFISEDNLNITYLKTDNGGKQRAMNLAATRSEDDLFMCVDSDDYLTDNALADINSKWKEYEHNAKIAGLLALRGVDPQSPLYDYFPSGITTVNAWDLYEIYGFKGDLLHVYRTDIMRDNPSVVADGEKFISEGYYIHKIAQQYDMGLLDEVVYVGGYLPDGYSNHARDLAKNNPNGYALNKKLAIEMSKKLSSKFYNSILYLAGCSMAGKFTQGIKEAPYKGIAILCAIPALVACKVVFK